MAGRVEGKVAFITGAARGQGRSHAIRLAQEGADIVAVDICEPIDGVPYPLATEEDLRETVRSVEALDRRIVARKADVRDLGQLQAAVSEGVDQFGRLDIVCANAGISGRLDGSRDPELRVRRFDEVVAVNLSGVFRTIEATKRAVIDTGEGGSIIITSSLAALRTLGGPAGYVEAKHGVVGMMRGYATQLARHRIRVNSVHPTNVPTPMLLHDELYRVFRPDLENPTQADAEVAMAGMHLWPLPYVEAVDISNAVLFLASDEGRYITGVALPVDLGAAIK
ncbi:mycofactocin-coupled SDR family oxidoreductase [Trujillonella endophytica]|uniref:(+)-trans-carveol dehydrogenase n=1 Tax=Trujillonella endophytica TaxID=673521 RepID=A0A1H8QST6_9ACTN|nr:mycofactocin-coupled SDR family oxidoreductase [Trujillella endophytica]SEO57262.1 (+)-trans-carveol dehydrogenase [Trujillella endophytica]